mmetsp:Transcript_26501/g.43076  ORF Transcript_26501/g.43076 Transcript_26501/m.43076 type:complete len:712 (+) Transcript_26501:95-2230(+)
MLRRIAQQNRGHSICQRATKCKNYARHVATSANYGDKKSSSYRRGRGNGARQLGVANPSSSSALTQSSERHSSTGAALATWNASNGEIIHGEEFNEMINPFLNRNKTGSDNGFLELFKAISSLNNRHNDFNQTLVMSVHLPDTEIYAEEEEEETVTSSGADIVKVNTKVQLDDPPLQDQVISLSDKLDKALRESCRKSVLEAFEEERTSSENTLSEKQLGRIITFLAENDVGMSFEAIKYHVEQCKAEGRMAPLFLYHYMMSGLKNCTSQIEVERLVLDIQEHVIEEYSDGEKAVYKYILLPQLALTVARLGHNDCARPLVEYFLEEKYPLINPDIHESLLKTAWRHPFAREDWTPTLPYHRLLSELVSCGNRPKPEVVTRVLHTYYPYRDLDAITEILSSIQQLHHYEDHPYDYSIDCGTLETISVLVSKRGSVDLSLLIIEMAESFGYKISESMFEDVILSFAASRQVPQCLGALVDMETNGYVPSRELLRKVAKKLSYDDKRLRYTQHILTGDDNANLLSTATMNSLLMGYGMKKNIQAAFDVFDSFQELGLKPDSNTVTFLMEILYFSTTMRFGRRSYAKDSLGREEIDDVVGEIDVVLSTMKEGDIEPTRHFYHEYVRLLCSLGLFEDGKLALEEAVSNNINLQVGTIFLLSVQCAHRGHFDMARDVARLAQTAGCGKQPTLLRRINNLHNQKLGVWGRPREEIDE